jgi:hypothetical protein
MRAGTRRAIGVGALGAAVGLAGIACRGSRPVGALTVQPASVNLPRAFAAPITLRWTPAVALDGLQGRPRVFVHVLDGGRKLLRTFDHPLPEPWAPGRAQSYEVELYQSAIAEPLPAGAYEMTFGLYDDAGRNRWPLAVQGEEVGRREYRLATLVVPPAAPPSPSFQFAGGWMPVEPGSSKQVVARRCLSGEGSIAVVGPPGPGTVRVAASLPGSDARSGPGAAWRVSASCSAEAVEVSATTLTWVGFPVTADAASPPCEARFTPSPGSAQTLCLEALAWRPTAP